MFLVAKCIHWIQTCNFGVALICYRNKIVIINGEMIKTNGFWSDHVKCTPLNAFLYLFMCVLTKF